MRNPVKTAKRQLLRVGSCALSALMVLGSIPAAAIGDGVTATYDEAYYAMTDYYGNLTDGSVVKSYRFAQQCRGPVCRHPPFLCGPPGYLG